VRDPVGLIAQAVATERRLIVNWIPAGLAIVSALQQAEKDNSVAIVIVDPWIVRDPYYGRILASFDQFQFRNCVVIIPWNKDDVRTQSEKANLLHELRSVLSRNFEGRKELYFRPGIEDQAAFRSAISCALSDLESLLARYRTPVRSVGVSEFVTLPQLEASGT